MIQLSKKFLEITPTDQKLKSIYFVLSLVVMGLLELIGLTAILPLIAIIDNPNLISELPIISHIYNTGFLTDRELFIYLFGIVVITTQILAGCTKYVSTKIELNFLSYNETELSCRLMNKYLEQEYTWFFNQHSANLSKRLLSETRKVIHGGLLPFLQIAAHAVLILFILLVLFVTNFWVTVVAFSIVGGSYGVITSVSRSRLNRLSKLSVDMESQRFQVASETLAAIKQVKITNSEAFFSNVFKESSDNFVNAWHRANTWARIPKFIIESIIYVMVTACVLLISWSDENISVYLPTLAVFAVCLYKLMPLVQQVYVNMAHLRFVDAIIDDVLADLSLIDRPSRNSIESIGKSKRDRPQIEFKNVSFSYANRHGVPLSIPDFKISVGDCIGITGPTGSGKTTFVDLLVGLLTPSKGKILINGVNLGNHNSYAWRNRIAYVPQDPIILDASVYDNIIFGRRVSSVNVRDEILGILELLDLQKFIEEQLPSGLDTKLGEQGSQLSGGQKQRIAIARALYGRPEMLILDEATSSLDNNAQSLILKNIMESQESTTIIMIAHRVETLENCNVRIELDNKSHMNIRSSQND
jgi:ATP-binding cassette, subfamily B, bacterial PglK